MFRRMTVTQTRHRAFSRRWGVEARQIMFSRWGVRSRRVQQKVGCSDMTCSAEGGVLRQDRACFVGGVFGQDVFSRRWGVETRQIMFSRWGVETRQSMFSKSWGVETRQSMLSKCWGVETRQSMLSKSWGVETRQSMLSKCWGVETRQSMLSKCWGVEIRQSLKQGMLGRWWGRSDRTEHVQQKVSVCTRQHSPPPPQQCPLFTLMTQSSYRYFNQIIAVTNSASVDMYTQNVNTIFLSRRIKMKHV